MKQIVLILIFCGVIFAKESDGFFRESSFSIGYFGELLTHPGLQLGAEQTILETRSVSLNLREEFFFYRHKRNHDMLGVTITLPVKIPSNRRFSGELFGGCGYLLKLTNSEAVYSYSEAGSIEKTSRIAMHRFSLITGLGLNASIVQKERLALGLYLRPTVFWEYPYNNSFLLHGALGFGINLNFNKGE